METETLPGAKVIWYGYLCKLISWVEQYYWNNVDETCDSTEPL